MTTDRRTDRQNISACVELRFAAKKTITFTFPERAFNRAFQFDEGPKSMTPVKDQNRLALKFK